MMDEDRFGKRMMDMDRFGKRRKRSAATFGNNQVDTTADHILEQPSRY